MGSNTPKYILLHHSASQDHPTFDYSQLMDWHINHNGWRTIGYHYVIEKVNDLYVAIMGRMPNERGAHCPEHGMNRKSIGICFNGNFEVDTVPDEQWDLGVKLVCYLTGAFTIPIDNIKGHKHFKNTLCPGKNFSVWDFTSDVMMRLGG